MMIDDIKNLCNQDDVEFVMEEFHEGMKHALKHDHSVFSVMFQLASDEAWYGQDFNKYGHPIGDLYPLKSTSINNDD